MQQLWFHFLFTLGSCFTLQIISLEICSYRCMHTRPVPYLFAPVFLCVNKFFFFTNVKPFISRELLTFRLWFYSRKIEICKWIYCHRLNHSMYNMTVQMVCNYFAANIIWKWHSLYNRNSLSFNVYSFVTIFLIQFFIHNEYSLWSENMQKNYTAISNTIITKRKRI